MMRKRNCAAFVLALICLMIPLSACGGADVESLESLCQSALSSAQQAEGVTFTETWTLEDKGERRTLTDMTISLSGDNWARTLRDTFSTEEVQYDGTQYQRVEPEDWAPTVIQAYESFWTDLNLSSFYITEAVQEDDGTIILTVGGEPVEDSNGNTTQLEALEFVLNEDGSLNTCREILRLTSLSAEETALRGILTVEVTLTDLDADSVAGTIEAVHQEASEGYAELLQELEEEASSDVEPEQDAP